LHWTFTYNTPLFIPWAIQKLARKKYFWKAFPHQATFTHYSQFMSLSSGLMPQNGKTCNYLAIAILIFREPIKGRIFEKVLKTAAPFALSWNDE
jgi:hypothetical protein